MFRANTGAPRRFSAQRHQAAHFDLQTLQVCQAFSANTCKHTLIRLLVHIARIRFPDKKVIKEKEAHIEQLLEEREIERSDVAKATLEKEQVGLIFLKTILRSLIFINFPWSFSFEYWSLIFSAYMYNFSL
ncbi:unnamed protein product [Protopolystoma xenopodis]|uniref:Uncharacterized protein n=1 Tax=Protopolystoma xenopodis TaxID=117903 RepID=A0A448WAY1_9PLAT|nr:unnamed protein product [Protopolystoma xenopodis]